MRARAEIRTGIAREDTPRLALVGTRRRDWTQLPEAAALLAACAARPPATRMTEVTGLSTYHARHYVGARVRALGAIHRAEGRRLFALAEASRDYAAFDAHVRLTVQQAIGDALLHAAIARSAACDARALAAVESVSAGADAAP